MLRPTAPRLSALVAMAVMLAASPLARAAGDAPPSRELRGLELSRSPAASFAPWLEADDLPLGVQAATALGRLHDPQAVPLLEAALASEHAPLRSAAAFSLGQYPGTAGILLGALAQEGAVEVRAALMDAMGRSGDEGVVEPLLAAAAGEDTSLAVTACHALGRLGVRGVLTAPSEPVVTVLLDQLGRFDQDRRRAAAFALARTKPSSLPPDLAARLERALEDQPDAITRAWLVRAAATGLDPQGWERVSATAAEDAALGVRVALARGLASRADGAASPSLAPLLADEDRPVRVAALESAGRLTWDDTWEPPLQAMLELRDPELLARTLPILARADKLAEPEGWLNPTVDSAVRAAMMATLDDPAALAAFAVDDRSQVVRTSATEQLLSLEPAADRTLLWPLLEQPDSVVACLVAQALAEHPDGELLGRVQLQLVERIDYDGLLGMIDALSTILEGSGVVPGGPKRPSLPGSTDHQVSVRIAELQSHDDPALRKAAGRLGALLALPPPQPAAFPSLAPQEALDALLGARVVTTRGEFALAFQTAAAPYAVQRWVDLAETGAFDGTRFHRIVPDFVVQGGCPRGDGYGGPGYALPDELSPLPYDTWAVGMASAGPDTAGSQWFVTLSPQPHLDGDYTLFGQVVKGTDVLRRLTQDDQIEAVIIERRPEQATSPRP